MIILPDKENKSIQQQDVSRVIKLTKRLEDFGHIIDPYAGSEFIGVEVFPRGELKQ